jgi:hypothetical protein
MEGGSDPAYPAQGAPAGKAAANILAWKTVKSFDFAFNFAFKRTLTVPAGAGFSAWTNTIAPADPILIAFYRTSGAAGATAYTTQVVAYNDDRGDGTRNADIRWTNATGSSKTVEVMLFAYSPATQGNTNLVFIDPNSVIPRGYNNLPIRTSPVYLHTNPGPFAGCTGSARASQIQLKHVVGGGFVSGILAFNRNTFRGGYIRENGTATQTLRLGDILPSGGGNFLLGFMLDTDELGYEPTRFTAVQQDQYSCTLQPF